MDVNTHFAINRELCGEPVTLGDGEAVVSLKTTDLMRADQRGLIHGGFIFGMADYAAMLAVNDPNVVLGAADTKFLKPAVSGDTVLAHAKLIEEKGKKRKVSVEVRRDEDLLFSGEFTCFVLEKHVFDL